MTHAELVKKAAVWLSNQGAVAVCTEMRAWCCVEQPDVIGWEFTGKSAVIECKVTRSDFLADRKKEHRQKDGLGNLRYFAVPKGLIRVDELPEGWGLIQTSGNGMRMAHKSATFDANLDGERVFLVAFARYCWRPDWRATHNADAEAIEHEEPADTDKIFLCKSQESRLTQPALVLS